jgi:hypothetical protein
MPENYGQDVLDEHDEIIRGTWEYGGEEYALKCESISYADFKLVQQYGAIAGQVAAIEAEAEATAADGDAADSDLEAQVEDVQERAEGLDDFSWEADDEDRDFVESVIGEKLVQPEPDLATTSPQKLSALVDGMIEAWQEGETVAQAKAEMPVEGNR